MEKIVPNRNLFRESWLSFLFGHYPERAMEALKKGSADPSRRLMIASIADNFLKTEPTNHLAMVADRQIQLLLWESIWNLERFLRHRNFGVESLRADLGLIADGTYRNYYGLGPQWAVRRVREALLLIHYCGVTPQDMGFQPGELLAIVTIAESDALKSAASSPDSSDEVFFDGSSRRSFDALFNSFRGYLEEG